MSPRTRLIAGILSLLVVLGALGAYFYLRSTALPPFDPQGSLLLSLALKGSSEVNLYEYDLSARELRRIAQDGNSNFDGRISLDGTRIAHIAYGPGALASQVVVYDPASGERRPVTRGEAFRHSPDWSPVGSSLAFSQDVRGGSDIYAAYLPGTPRRIGAGRYPVWSLDGRSLFALSPEGLLRYDLASGAPAVSVWGAKGAGMKLAASPDHSLIAWLIPSVGEVRLFKGNPVNPGELLLNATLKARAYDVAFSPDNAYAAMRILDEAKGSFSVAIERLDTGERREVLDLSPYEPRSLYLTAWKI
ncbi:MAG TPA: hypothetical protein VD967_02280 [Candidatus Paceibacterota bacterium]|nr:hypothetical protein [Candidatus Paceibacterota bacterium]